MKFGVVIAVGVGLLITLLVTGQYFGYPVGEHVFYAGTMAYFLVLGAIIIRRVPGNRVGWVFVTMALAIGGAGVVAAGGERSLLAVAVGGALWLLWVVALPVLFFWYPTGRAPTNRWRWVERGLLTVAALVVLGTLFADRLCIEDIGATCAVWADNPIGIPGVPNTEYAGPGGPLLIVILVTSLVALFSRYRNGSPTERLQVKWFLFATILLVLSIVLEIGFETFGEGPAPGWTSVLNGLAIASIPIAATLAILRYRLYEIDRLVSRTVTYALVIGLLGAVYLASVSVLTTFLPSDDPVAVAVGTLAAAALFNPLRTRLRDLVDRRFNRVRFDATRVVESFVGTLGDRVDQEGLVEGWLGVVSETMHPRSASVWVRPG